MSMVNLYKRKIERMERETDTDAVRSFTGFMETRMEEALDNGKRGWWNDEAVSTHELRNKLLDQFEKRDWVDVANYAMMLHYRTQHEEHRDNDEGLGEV